MARILVVDDSPVMRRSISIILKNDGHEIVAEASNGMQALNEYEAHLPDLVTMDITMPLMDGIEAVKRIIKKFPEAKIVMISALGHKDRVFEAVKNGAKHYIIKPFTKEKVNEVINVVLNTN